MAERTNNYLQNTTERLAVPSPLVAPVVLL